MDVGRATAKQRRVWERSAPEYDRAMARFERGLLAGSREWIGARATGRTLEVAIGTGRSLGFYADDVELTGVDLSPAMLAQARGAAARLGRVAEFREADAEALPFPDASFDTVVCALGLCSIPRPGVAVREMARVLRPGGSLLLLDHVGSTWPPVWALQWLLERLTIPLQGEHFTRRQVRAVRDAGLTVAEDVRSSAGIIERVRATKG